MKAQTVEQVELFTEAELESLDFVPEELEAIEQERVPNLESISFEDIAEDLEASLEADRRRRRSTFLQGLNQRQMEEYRQLQDKIMQLSALINLTNRRNPRRLKFIAKRAALILQLKIMERRFR